MIKALNALLAIAVLSPAAVAAETDAPMLSFSAGQFGFVEDRPDPNAYGIEYRGHPVSRWNLVPAIGIAWASDGAKYLYHDLRRHFWLTERWVLTPSSGFGVFDDGDEIRLGHTVEFRTGMELARRFDGGRRLGLIVYHLSNAGLGRRNPGNNALMITLTIPI